MSRGEGGGGGDRALSRLLNRCTGKMHDAARMYGSKFKDWM